MSHAEPWRQRGGYCEYPGITPPGNPDWWAGEITWPPVLPVVRAAEPTPVPAPTPEPAEPITPVDEPTKPRIARDDELARHWITQASQATAPPPTPGGARRWWHYLTARRTKETKTP